MSLFIKFGEQSLIVHDAKVSNYIPLTESIFHLQDLLFSIGEDDLDYITSQIFRSNFVMDFDSLNLLSQDLINAYRVHSTKIREYSIFVHRLNDFWLSQDKIKDFAHHFITLLLDQILQRFSFSQGWIANLWFLRYLQEEGLVTIEDIYYRFESIIFAPFKQTRDRESGLTASPRYICCFLSIFHSSIKPEIFQDLGKHCEQLQSSIYPFEMEIYKEYKSLIQNNWQEDPMMISLKTDNLDEFQAYAVRSKFSLNYHVPPSVFEPSSFLQNSPPIISVAAYYSSIKIFKYLLINGADLTAKDQCGHTIDVFATAGGNVEIIQLVKQNMALSDNLLTTAIEFHRSDVFKWLYQFGVSDEMRNNLLSYASSTNYLEVCKFLVDKNADINCADFLGMTPLLYASQNGSYAVASFLLDFPTIHITCRENKGWNALQLATINGHDNIVDMLLARPEIDVNNANQSGRTALMRASRDNHPTIVEKLLKRAEINVNDRDKKGRTALHFAVLNQHLEVAKLLLADPRVDVNVPDENGGSPLHIASPQFLQLLIDSGKANINLKNYLGWTPLIAAVANNDEENVVILINHHADVNAKNLYNRTALHYAAENENGRIIKMLLDNNADPSIEDKEGKTAKELGNDDITNLF